MGKYFCYFDETEFKIEGTAYLALAGVFIAEENMSVIEDTLTELKETLEVDQFIGSTDGRRLFHFVEDNQEVQPKVIDCIRNKGYKAYIAYKKLGVPYHESYTSIMRKILLDRIKANNTSDFFINYEETDKVKFPKVSSLLEDIISTLREEHPTIEMPSLQKVTKQDIYSVIPDYILGVFQAYNRSSRQDYMRRDFEKLRNKIRLIVDIESDIYYHRGNPFVK